MKFGVREICDVVLKAKAKQVIGNKTFAKHEPVIYFDTLKTSSMEGAATTVYATGGRGNSRLMAWEGERTVTFTMEDALISPEGFMILSGAGLIEASSEEKIYQHITETVAFDKDSMWDASKKELTFGVSKPAHFGKDEDFIYVFLMRDGELVSEPYIGDTADGTTITISTKTNLNGRTGDYTVDLTEDSFKGVTALMVDYYTVHESGAKQIEITPDQFGGNYYLEASTLFRTQAGVDMPAEFIIPNCKIQSNFTFTMASSGDPSTFTFTMDAFPDYTRFDPTKKVLAAIQIIDSDDDGDDANARRMGTVWGTTSGT